MNFLGFFTESNVDSFTLYVFLPDPLSGVSKSLLEFFEIWVVAGRRRDQLQQT